jgi:hypothetical protein
MRLDSDPERHRRSRLATFAFLASAIVTTAVTPAWAQPSLSDRETARNLMDDGDAKRDRGDLKAALASYEAADAIMHVPTTGLEVGRTQAQLGQLLEARDTLARILRLPAKPGEPAPFTAARKVAETLGLELAARIPTVSVTVSHNDPAQPLVVLFDGETLSPAAAQAPRKVNPGHHVVVARSGSFERKSEVDVAESEWKTVPIDFPPVAVADVPPPSSDGPSVLPKVLIYGGFTGGVVGIGVGAVAGLMSLSKLSDVKKDCVNDVCPSSRAGDLESVRELGTLSTVAFIVGGAGLGAGILGLILDSRQPSETTPGTSAKIRVRPELGPTWAGLAGTF